MEDLEAILLRHSVRSYKKEPIETKKVKVLESAVQEINKVSGLCVKLMVNEPKAFGNILTHYGKFKNVSNYFVMAGKNCKDLDEKIGYHGERLVLEAQKLGLNTCWVALTYSKGVVNKLAGKDEKVVCVISLGKGETQGTARRSKTYANVTSEKNTPEWFKQGIKCALLAPTAMNQQKFKFYLNDDGSVVAKSLTGFYSKLDLGIVKLHFEIGAGKDNFKWAN